MIHEHRLGRFKVNREFLKRWKDCQWMFGNFVIVSANDRSWDTNEVEYLAFSELFDVADQNCVVPEYDIEIDQSICPPVLKATKIK